jgi:hypothetical protein
MSTPTYLLTYAILLFSCCLALELQGQETSLLLEYNQQRLQTQSKGMVVLGSWALGNIALGAYGLRHSSGPSLAFHQMNLGWNLVNLGIAGWGYYSAMRGEADLAFLPSFEEQKSIEKILLFNAGLDVGYMMTGVFLLERAKRAVAHSDRWRGFGQSLLLQGGFLFVFDLILVAVHQKNWNLMLPKLESWLLPQSGPALGMSWQYSF